ncbi:MAG: site-specific integrase [Lachnospiraceae bacterium]|nr:site-specific integrase [Lachnospiraceae bacterium]
MANIRKRGSSYQIEVYAGSDEHGRPIRKTMTFHPTATASTKIQKEVQAAAADFERRIHAGKFYEGESMRFRDLADKWLDVIEKSDEVHTVEGYKSALNNRINPAIGHIPVGKITPIHLQDLYHKMLDDGLKIGTIKRHHSIINGILKYAFKMELIQSNPCDRVTIPKSSKKYNYQIWTSDQIDKFFSALKQQYTHHYAERRRVDKAGNIYTISAYNLETGISSMYTALYTLSIFSSCRRGELAPLTWEDVNFDKKELYIHKAVSITKTGIIMKPPKTNAGYRRIKIPDRCITALKEWKKDQIRLSFELGSMWEGLTGKDFDKNYIFIQKDSGRMIHVDTIGKKFKNILNEYNKSCKDPSDRLPEIRLHDLRHTGASLLLANNVDVVTVSHRLGHAKPSTTMDIYSHAIPSQDQVASDVLDNLVGSS